MCNWIFHVIFNLIELHLFFQSDDEELDENYESIYFEELKDEKPKLKFKKTSYYLEEEPSFDEECVIDTQTQEPEKLCLCFSTDELIMFGRHVGVELGMSRNHMAIQKAKLEINKVLFKLTTGHYDLPESLIIEHQHSDT